jgi:hypothetical protein
VSLPLIMSLLLKKLFTHEDRFNIHKLLGITCLIQFAYQYYLAWNLSNKFNTTITNGLFFTLHPILSLSSFLFRVPLKRNPVHSVIWTELRLHNIIFVLRSYSVLLLVLFLDGWEQQYWLRLNVVLFHHVLADYVTKQYGSSENGTTVRSNDKLKDRANYSGLERSLITPLERFASISQFMATIVLLVTDDPFLVYITMFPIQISTFLFTLVKKGAISNKASTVLYALALLSTYPFLIKFPLILSVILVSIARFHFKIDKYVIWTTYVCIYQNRIDVCCTILITIVMHNQSDLKEKAMDKMNQYITRATALLERICQGTTQTNFKE